MQSVKTVLNNKIDIQIIFKKKYNWYMNSGLSSWVIDEDTVNELLNRFEQLVFINLNTIINIDCVDASSFNIVKEYVSINGQVYVISKKHMPLLKHVLKEKFPNLFSTIQLHSRGTYFRRVNSKRKIHTINVKYLLRKGTQTIIFYEDGTNDYFYETLKYFYEYVLEHDTFIRVRRDCIINIKFIDNYKINNKDKTGIILIDSEVIQISRRNLQVFKRFMEKQTKKNENTFIVVPKND